jgi:AraC-like DNA-binding protein
MSDGESASFTRRQEEEEMGSVLENGDSATLTAGSCIGHSSWKPVTNGIAGCSDRHEFFIRDQRGNEPLTDLRRHEHFQICIEFGGDTAQHIAGEIRPLSASTLTFVLPYRLHLVRRVEASRIVVINFSQRFLRPDLSSDSTMLDNTDLTRAPELVPFLFQEHLDFTFGGAEHARLRELVDAMLSESHERAFGSLEILRGMLLQLIGLTCRHFEAELLRLAATYGQMPRRHDAVARVGRYIREHWADNVSLAGAATAAFVSPKHLAHLLKKETGKTFTELVTERRLERARELLDRTTQRIADIAHECGFADQAYFTRRFKHWSGLTPRAYRNVVSTIVRHRI